LKFCAASNFISLWRWRQQGSPNTGILPPNQMYDNLEDNDFNIHRRENFKSYMFYKIVDEN
jgi:hypothetical protein